MSGEDRKVGQEIPGAAPKRSLGARTLLADQTRRGEHPLRNVGLCLPESTNGCRNVAPERVYFPLLESLDSFNRRAMSTAPVHP